MQHFRLIVFLASLALNAALAVVFLLGASPAPATSAASAPAPPHVGPVAAPQLDATVWPRLQAGDDLPALIARLRASGFPPSVIRAVVVGLLKEKFNARRRALDPAAGSRPFWQNDRPPDPKLQLALHRLDREFEHTLTNLLGEDARDSDPADQLERQRQFAHLPPGQADRVREIVDRYQQLQEDLGGAGGLTPGDRIRQQELKKEERAAIAQVLSPAELEAYNLRSSDIAERVRSTLSLFDASEDEFKAIYRAQSAFYDEFGSAHIMRSAEETARRTEGEQALKEQIKTALGPDRYAEYERTTDFSYRRTAQLVARLELPPAAATQAWSVQKDIQQRADTLRADPALSDAQRTAQLTTLVAEATDRITAALGARGFTEYNRNGGSWLRELAPKK